MAASTTATAGTPGAFDGDVPATLAALVSLGPLGATAVWTVGQFVTLGAGTAYWDGGKWVAGKVPAPAAVVPGPAVAAAATAGDYVGTTITWTTPPTRYLRRERHRPRRRTAR